MFIKVLIFVVFSFISLVYAQNAFIARRYNEQEKQLFTGKSTESQLKDEINVKVNTAEKFSFMQKLDHDKSKLNPATFEQYYSLNRKYYREGGPVFLYINGESQMSGLEVMFGNIVNLARQFGAMVVSLEHRYYGQSTPTTKLTTENLKYLSSRYALQDIASFIPYFNAKFGLDANSTKWIVHGGSYAGNLAAWFRLKYPDLAYAAWAVSGPVFAKVDFFEYDQVVAESLGASCADYIRLATRTMESMLSSNDETLSAQIKNMFHPKMQEQVPDKLDFLSTIVYLIDGSVQYGVRSELDQLCNNFKSISSLSKNQQAMAAIKGYANYTYNFFLSRNEEPKDLGCDDCSSIDLRSPADMYRQWIWQMCTEFGFFVTGNYTNPVRTVWATAQSGIDYCRSLYGFSSPFSIPVEETNAFFLGRDILQSSSRIMFTNGQLDPWTPMSVVSTPVGAFNQDDYGPDASLALMIPGASHCADMAEPTDDESDAMRLAHQHIQERFKIWLQ